MVGEPAIDVSPGQSLARRFADLDSDDNASDFVVLDSPTPGVAEFAAVPEPGAALLLGLGLSGLASVASLERRRGCGMDSEGMPRA